MPRSTTTKRNQRARYKTYRKKGYSRRDAKFLSGMTWNWRARSKLYRTPTLRPGTVAPIKFTNEWHGDTVSVIPAYGEYSKLGLAFNPFIGQFVTNTDYQTWLQRFPDAYGDETKFAPPASIRQSQYFINPYLNPTFRKFLTMYQEVKCDYVCITLTPISDSGNSMDLPVYISNFVDRKYSGIGGSAIDKYLNPADLDKDTFEDEFSRQGKKWMYFVNENRYYKYKVYQQATGLDEKNWLTTETLMTRYNTAGIVEDTLIMFMGFYNQSFSPYQYRDAIAGRQLGFAPTTVFMLKLAKKRNVETVIPLRWHIKVGYTFRNPGSWNDGTTYDWYTNAWLQAPNAQLDAVSVGEEEDDPHSHAPLVQTAPLPVDPTPDRMVNKEIRMKRLLQKDDPTMRKAQAAIAQAKKEAAAAAADELDTEVMIPETPPC